MFGRCLSIVALLLMGCELHLADSSGVADLDMRGWSYTAEVAVMNKDTLLKRDLRLFLRHEQGFFEEDTLRLRVLRRSPLFRFREDTVQLVAPRRERALGSGYAIATAPYLEDVVLKEQGVYLFYITPLEKYLGCSAVGVQLILK